MSDSTDFWDAVVVGAGIAGGATAAMLAQRGWPVLLVERSVWPREKVCGGCLSASAIDALHEIGVDSAIGRAEPTTSVVWQADARTFEHSLPRGAAILRGDFDASIVSEAVRRGCQFMSGCSASLLPTSSSDSCRVLRLKAGHRTIEWRAGIVIACDGIGEPPCWPASLGRNGRFRADRISEWPRHINPLGFGFTGPHLHVHGE